MEVYIITNGYVWYDMPFGLTALGKLLEPTIEECETMEDLLQFIKFEMERGVDWFTLNYFAHIFNNVSTTEGGYHTMKWLGKTSK